MTSAPAIGFEYRPSAWPARLEAVVGALAALATLASGLPGWMKALVAAGVVAAVLAGRFRPQPLPVAVGWSEQSGWTLHTRAGDDLPAQLRYWRILGNGMVLRLVDGSGGAHALWLLADNCDSDTRRRLRMRLTALPSAS